MKDVEYFKPRFDKHVLTCVSHKDAVVQVYDYRDPDSGIYAQRWIIDRGTLIVTGDCYSSIYKWNDRRITLGNISGFNVHYFSSKCVADKDGESQNIYCPDYAEELLKEEAVERIYEELSHDSREMEELSDEEWSALSLEEKLEMCEPIIRSQLEMCEYQNVENLFYHERESDAFDWVCSSENEFMFGQDPWELHLRTRTWVPYMHLAAIQSAYKQYAELC